MPATPSYIFTSRLFDFVGVIRLSGLHLKPYRLMCEDIVLSKHLTAKGALRALKAHDLDMLALDAEITASGQDSIFTPVTGVISHA